MRWTGCTGPRPAQRRQMARILADAIETRAKLVIVADYDADGATACAVGIRALRAFGGDVDYLVPNRFEYGYGLTPEIVALAPSQQAARIIITVDNGIASIEGVAEANRLGMRVLDHRSPSAGRGASGRARASSIRISRAAVSRASTWRASA